MSFEKFENMSPEELESRILKLKGNLRYIPTKIGENTADGFAIKFKSFLNSLSFNDILTNPEKVYNDFISIFGLDKKDVEDIILTLLTIFSFWRSIRIIKSLDSLTNGHSKVAIWLNRFTMMSMICSLYKTLIEIYCFKTNETIREKSYKYIKDQWDCLKTLWNLIRTNWYKPWAIVKYWFKEYIINITLKLWKWQWEVGRLDPFKLYHPLFIMDIFNNTGIILCSIFMGAELYQSDVSFLEVVKIIINGILGKAQTKGIDA